MNDFLEKLQKGMNSLLGKAGVAVESGKMHFEIQKYLNKIGNLEKDLGKFIYLKHQKDVTEISFEDETIKKKIREINFYMEKIQELEKK